MLHAAFTRLPFKRRNQNTISSLLEQENTQMLIYMLATAMTIVMLIATAFGLHQEAGRVRVKANTRRLEGFVGRKPHRHF